MYKTAVRKASQFNLKVDWLIPNLKALEYLQNEGMIQRDHNILKWRNTDNCIWEDYRYVIGPASTSVYECIMVNAIPISFPISTTQTTELDNWLEIGHCLHLNHTQVSKSIFVESLFDIAFTNEEALRKNQEIISKSLDGRGSQRVKCAVEKFLNNNQIVESFEKLSDGLHHCTFASISEITK